MSSFREAQQWLELNGLYPRAGLALAVWNRSKSILAVRTRDLRLILYRVSSPEMLWESGPDHRVAGFEFLKEHKLVCRRYAHFAPGGVVDPVSIEVEQIEGAICVKYVGPTGAFRTLGFSSTGRFQLVALGRAGLDSRGLLDLGSWDRENPGLYKATIDEVMMSELEPDISFAWISPDGTRSILRQKTAGNEVSDQFTHLGGIARSRSLPQYHWAEPSYLWSPNGEWFAAVIAETTPDTWDELPVGGPDLRNYVATYSGSTGEQIFSREVETVFAPFEWLNNNQLEAANRRWDLTADHWS